MPADVVKEEQKTGGHGLIKTEEPLHKTANDKEEVKTENVQSDAKV